MNIMATVRIIGNALLDLTFPPRCHLCKEPVSSSSDFNICNTCMTSIQFITSPVCNVCGIPFSGKGEDHICSRCIENPPPYKAARAAMVYDGGCKEMLHGLKYNHKTSLRRPLGLITAKYLETFVNSWKPDSIVPVPLHLSRLRSRGFNQSILIGEILARNWRLPLIRDELIRKLSTIPQVELSREQRLSNLKGAFCVKPENRIRGRRVLLVDDVFTTGSTLSEASATLLREGASEVFAVTAAHAP